MNKSISYCSSKFGNITNLENHLQIFANTNIEYSYELLLMSSHFGSYKANREGFKALYRKLSDKAWENAITIIKFITKRGSKMNFISSINEHSDVKVSYINIYLHYIQIYCLFFHIISDIHNYFFFAEKYF